MDTQHGLKKTVLWILLLGCLLVETKFILFKRSPHYYKIYFAHEYSRNTIKEGWKHANLKPFATISLFYNSRRMREEYKYDNIGGNIIGFIPLGILLPIIFLSLRKIWKTVFIVFCISLFFETTQLLTGLGVFDVDDLILNTAGGLIGYLIYLIIKRVAAT